MFLEYYQIGMILFSFTLLYIVTLYRWNDSIQQVYMKGFGDGVFYNCLKMALELDETHIASFTKAGLMIPFRSEMKLTEDDVVNIKNLLAQYEHK